ncbi:hypothetical protein [Tunicatimonas pelagia]|uniref:hypothetical protein n=1 Tax=Tunicatimonas pelagia TaxID=931531 RepID=UPI0026670BC0|nr:hypothetical protein [Tunicatimonas pelagia]WKN44319.1 hypothetical protein P0M28_04990 [Tunicatimonas pelagia]
MTDQEFDVLDELYFVTSFEELSEAVGMKEDELFLVLKALLEKKWIKCYQNHSEELLAHEVDINQYYQAYSYLATKAGLLVHNGR